MICMRFRCIWHIQFMYENSWLSCMLWKRKILDETFNLSAALMIRYKMNFTISIWQQNRSIHSIYSLSFSLSLFFFIIPFSVVLICTRDSTVNNIICEICSNYQLQRFLHFNYFLCNLKSIQRDILLIENMRTTNNHNNHKLSYNINCRRFFYNNVVTW